MPAPPPLSAAATEELRRLIAQYGLAPVVDEIRRQCTQSHRRGRIEIDDSERLAAMGRHLAEDRDLPPGEGHLTELARRGAKDHPRPGDSNRDASLNDSAVRRLVRKFDVFCLDLAGRGFDQGNWALPGWPPKPRQLITRLGGLMVVLIGLLFGALHFLF